jgi:hypothetical protein
VQRRGLRRVGGAIVMDRRDRESLDRHITGNYGEDQFKGEERSRDGMNILRDLILARAVTALDNAGDESAAQSVESLRDVLRDDPKLAADLEKRIAKQLVKRAKKGGT